MKKKVNNGGVCTAMKIFRYQCLWESSSSKNSFRDKREMFEKFSTVEKEVEDFAKSHIRSVVGDEAWNEMDYDSFDVAELVAMLDDIFSGIKMEGALLWIYDVIEV